ncbi:MAG: hypothetical protein L0Z54_02740 [Thermoplasmata archaeon]|nr:hypothetical protein [Thermoplasmata archaeon]
MPISDLVRASREEVKAIFQWTAEREPMDRPPTVLIGGWAVYTYNPYYGSLDIDLVTSSRTRSSLTSHLVDARGFRWERYQDGQGKSVAKPVGRGLLNVDFATRETPSLYEGTKEDLPFRLLDDNTVRMDMDGIPVPVPTPSLLLLMKMKAAWDRNWRLSNGKSTDRGWETGKLVKDRADILALLFSQRSEGFDLDLIGSEMERHPFLEEMLDAIHGSADAAAMYRVGLPEAREIVERFKALVVQ